MRVLYQIQSRECERAEWRPWPMTVPFSCRADCEAQVELLNKNEPAPTRPWMAVRSFRFREVPAGCPSCLQDAIGPICAWHTITTSMAATVPAPIPVPVRKPMVATMQATRPRNLDGSWTSRKFARQAEAIGEVIRQARETATTHQEER